MSEIADEVSKRHKQRRVDGLSFFQLVLLVGMVLAAAVFVGNMLFGKNSWQVLISLKKQQRILEQKIYKTSKENASLQKKYFELKSLTPEGSERE